MATSRIRAGYFPVYPNHEDLPDPEIRTWITNFYLASDNPQGNELWVSQFTKDAQLIVGPDEANGEQEIRELREGMWTKVAERQHTVFKAFPGRFGEDKDDKSEIELMLVGKVQYTTKENITSEASFSAHGILKKEGEGEGEEWKYRYYRVWIQK